MFRALHRMAVIALNCLSQAMPPTCCHSPLRTLLSHLATYVSPTLVTRCLQVPPVPLLFSQSLGFGDTLSVYLSEPASTPLSPGKPPLVSTVPCSSWALKQWDHAAYLLLILTPNDLGSPAGELLPQTRSSGRQSFFGVGKHARMWAGVLQSMLV